MPAQWDAGLVLHQLRCCGVQEVTRIARAGYPTRYLHSDFARRYSILLPSLKSGTQASCMGVSVMRLYFCKLISLCIGADEKLALAWSDE